MSYGEDEEAINCMTCVASGGQDAPDTITGAATHAEFTNSADGQNSGGSGSHDVATEWYNSSVIGTKVRVLSEAEIVSQLDADGAGLGDYTIDITVNAQAGNAPGLCQRRDNGEDVSYTVQLIVLDYEITPYIEIEDL